MRVQRGRHRQRGQVIIMVTLALFAMIGLLGLAVDFGWAAFLEKSMQNAAESAAIAAVREATEGAFDLSHYDCSLGGVTCAVTPVDCPASGNLTNGCNNALDNGFDWTDEHTTVTIQAADRSNTTPGCTPLVYHPPTAPCVDTYYWVTVRVAQEVPQLFSAIWGNGVGVVSARATAAIAQSVAEGSLILLNRDNDPWGEGDPGENVYNQGGPGVRVPGGIVMASANSEEGGDPNSAGFVGGGANAYVESPFTWIRDDGDVFLQGGSTWVEDPMNEVAGDGAFSDDDPTTSPFYDPFYGLGQPQLASAGTLGSLPLRPIPSGNLMEADCVGGCGPGIYYATKPDPDCPPRTSCPWIPSGAPINIQGPDKSIVFSTSSFESGNFVFFGGMRIDHARVHFDPGRYVFAGVLPDARQVNEVFEAENMAHITGGSAASGGQDEGRLFIFTDDQYADNQLAPALSAVNARHPGKPMPDLHFGRADIKAGNNEESSITLQGLNREMVPESLKEFSPVVMWQDQRNSRQAYTSDGEYVICGSPANVNNNCPYDNSDGRGAVTNSAGMDLGANQFLHLWGAIYQPRGAWLTIWAGSGETGPLQVVTGSLRMQGGGDLTLTGLPQPIVNYVAALVE